MSEEPLLAAVLALLPATALLTVGQRHPGRALVLRGMLGAVASLAYALLGAADVALTEALVGTLLATMLYAVALRSSMVVRLELPADQPLAPERETALRQWLEQADLRLDLLPRDAAEACDRHGSLAGDGSRLLLRSAALAGTLQGLEGSARWQELGGELDLLVEPR